MPEWCTGIDIPVLVHWAAIAMFCMAAVGFLYACIHMRVCVSLVYPDLFFFYIGTGRKGSGEHSIASMLAYPILHLKGFLCANSGMLNDVIMLPCSLKKDDKVVKNALPTNTTNTISHQCSLISWSAAAIQFNNSTPRAVNSLRHSGSCAVQSPKSRDRPTAMIC